METLKKAIEEVKSNKLSYHDTEKNIVYQNQLFKEKLKGKL
jgi:hypothetical protein